MSNVQLSSSAMERLAARRTFPLHARRSLFGPVDHDELAREMKTKLREISERDQRRWNFNFEAGTPLCGDYEWEESPVETSPGFYQDSVQVGRSRTVVTPAAVKPCSDSSPQDCPSSQDLLLPVCKERLTGSESSAPGPAETNQENRTDKLNSGKRNRHVPCPPRRTRTGTSDTAATHITDFFVKRKRTAETKTSESNACQHSSSTIPVEQTPRKRIR